MKKNDALFLYLCIFFASVAQVECHVLQEFLIEENIACCIRIAKESDIDQLYDLYHNVASVPNTIALFPEEITKTRIADLLRLGIDEGLALVVESKGIIIGSMIKYPYNFKECCHALQGGSILVHTAYQGCGIGTRLIKSFLQEVLLNMPHILRVELWVRDNNPAKRLYERLGFVIEGHQPFLKLYPNGTLGDYYTMAWFNPSFDINKALSKAGFE